MNRFQLKYPFVGLLISLCFSISVSHASSLYKYKDKNGRWVFADQKPQHHEKVETLEYKNKKKPENEPRLFIETLDQINYLVFDNPYFAPVEIEVRSNAFIEGKHREVIDPSSTKRIFSSLKTIPKYKYKWRIGNPKTKEIKYDYLFPVSSKVSHRITQAFNGRFSHTMPPNIYSVDIATPVGTYISAARGGTVIWVKDDYHMGGKRRFFLDKANYVKVLHDDGSYAVYAHILLGSALVKAGDVVAAGDLLARGGSSGYSTGPHLHFVVRRNIGMETRSLPFKFVDDLGSLYTPRSGMEIDGLDGNF